MAEVSLKELAGLLRAALHAEHGDPACLVRGVAQPADAGPGEVALLTDPDRLEEGRTCRASALVVRRRLPHISTPQLVCDDPSRALGTLLSLFGPVEQRQQGIDPRAAVESSAKVHPTAWVGPFCYVGPNTTVGPATSIEPFCYLGASVQVGARCQLGPGATVGQGCSLGDEVVIGPGAVLGYRGFGFWREGSGWQPIPSGSNVVVGHGVEIGANTCVDRGTLGPTRVERGAKLDNLVQVGHNVSIGKRAMICAQVGLAGSAEVGADAVLAGQVGVADHRRVGRGAKVGAHSGVAHDVPDGDSASGYPAFEHRRWLRASALFKGLAELTQRVRELGRSVGALRQEVGELGERLRTSDEE
jgi:UDP-3-O-[3-hydroxymyristoyl] glucosamine N-acyltransferase